MASCEPDEARGSQGCEAYFLYVEHPWQPSNEVWRRKLSSHRGSRHGRDEVDLDQRVLHEQRGGAHRRPRWRRREELLPDLIESVEVSEIRQEHLRLHDLLERRPRRLERAHEVVQDVAR